MVVLAATTGAAEPAQLAATVGFRQPAPTAFPDLFVWTDTCNVYVLRDGDAALLIDLGDGSVLDHLADIGVKHVQWILLTHHHREQCQGIGRVDRTVTKVAAPQAEQALFETPTEFRKWYPTLGDKFSVYGASYARPPRQAIPLDKTLVSEEVFAWRGREIRCLDTPGHSPGSMTYVTGREGKAIAFTGGVMHDGAKMTTWFDSEWDYGFAKGVDALIASVELLIDQRLELALPSHGPAIRNPAAQLATYREKLTTFRRSYVRGYTIHVDWMPGQTEFGCSLWLELDGKRIVFTGDNLFGNPADVKQNGHEAVVARNSAVFEEGYLYGSRYLKNLNPDIVMGSHSYVMHDPAEFLERYHEWSQQIIELYRDLLPDKDYEYLFDPYWVSAYPYRVDFSEHDAQQVTVTVRNFRAARQRHRVELKLPPGVTAEPAVLEGAVDAESRRSFPVKLTVNREAVPPGVQIVSLDITLDDKRYGELFDFLIRTPARR